MLTRPVSVRRARVELPVSRATGRVFPGVGLNRSAASEALIEGYAASVVLPDADVLLHAMAIEISCDGVTLDSDYPRFPGLRWRVPG